MEHGSQQAGARSTHTVTASALFAGSGSFSAPVAVAVLVIRPGAVALARRTRVASAPSARSPTVHRPVAGS